MLPGIGIFGCCSTVKILVPILREKGFKVEAIWGLTLNEVSAVANELEIPFYTSKIDDVLLRKDVDLLFVMCAPNLHAQISVKALGIGKHVLCDKPAGLSQSDALKMVRASQYYPSLISVLNHSLRFLPTFRSMKSAIKDGYIGDITLIDVQVRMGTLRNEKYDWLCDVTMGGGTLTLVGSHVVDLISHLTGQKAVKVHAVIRTFKKTTPKINGIRNINAPDFCCFQMELKNGGLVTATLNNNLSGTFAQDILVCGTKGHLFARSGDLYGVQDKTQEVLYKDEDPLDTPSVSSLPTPYLKGLCHMIGALKEAFLPVEDKTGWVKHPVADAATFEDGLYVQAVIEALRRSSQEKNWVRIEILSEEPDPNPMLTAAVRKSGISG